MELKDLLQTIAPWIGTALGGPLGGMAVRAVGDALGLENATQDQIETALSGASHDQVLAIKNADQAFSVTMRQLGFDHETKLATLANENTNSARLMQISTKSLVPQVLAVVIVLGFLSLLACMMSGIFKTQDSQAHMLMLGALGASFGVVVNYYFGSTAESGRKTDMLSQAEPIKKEKYGN